MRKTHPIFALAFLGLAATALLLAQEKKDESKKITRDNGLVIVIVEESKEPGAQAGDVVWVHYTGKLQNGAKFDSSLDRGQPFKFVLGEGSVIKGWDQGLVGMKIGEKRQLTIPPALGYGAQGSGDRIPPNSTLVFDVQLIGIARPDQDKK